MFGNLMGKLQEVQQKAEEAKAFLAEARFTGLSENGLVTAIVDGNGKLVDVVLSSAVTNHPLWVVQDCIKAAVVDAQGQAATASAAVMKNAAKNLIPGFPGL